MLKKTLTALAVALAVAALQACASPPTPTAAPKALVETFDVGGPQDAIAFDGEDLWVADRTRGTVTRLRLRADGVAVEGIFPAGPKPSALAYGGGYLWVADSSEGVVRRMSLSGQVLGSTPTGTEPLALVYHAGGIWVANRRDGTVTKLATDGHIVFNSKLGGAPRAFVVAPEGLWVLDQGGQALVELNDADGMEKRRFNAFSAFSPGMPVQGEPGPTAAAFDGDAFWVLHEGAGTVTRVNREGVTVATVPVRSSSIAVLGAGVWAANAADGVLTRIDSRGALVQTVAVGGRPSAVVAVNDRLWVADAARGLTRVQP